MIYNFKDINKYNINYNIQVRIHYIQESINYTSIILSDINNKKIELIAFKKDMEKLKQFKLIVNNYYTLKNIQTIKNSIYQRTQHKFKLKFDRISTKIKLIKKLSKTIKFM